MEFTKRKQILCIIALLSADIAVMGDNAIYPIIANIYASFPEQIGLVNYIVSGPLFVIFLVSLCASKLFRYFSKKTIMLFGGLLFAVSSIFGVAIDNIYYIMTMRTLYGIAIALINVSAVTLIADIYVDEEKRNWMTGIFNGGMSIFGTIASLSSGVLAASDWKGAYRYYYIAIPMVILFLLFLPHMDPKQEQNQNQDSGTEAFAAKKEPYSFQFWITIIIVALVTLCFNIVANFSSTYIAEHGLGNTTTAGMVSASCTLGSMVFSFLFGGLYSKLKKHLLTLSSTMLIVSFAILYFQANLYLTFLAMFLSGGAYGIALAFSYGHGAALAPTRIDDAIGIATAAYAIGGFFSTYAATGMMNLLGTDQITSTFFITLIGAIVITVLYPILTAKQKN